MRKQLGRQALESTIVNCPHGIVAHILHDPYGLLTLPHRARLYRMTNRFDENYSTWRARQSSQAFKMFTYSIAHPARR
jgi:hypothetical protein